LTVRHRWIGPAVFALGLASAAAAAQAQTTAPPVGAQEAGSRALPQSASTSAPAATPAPADTVEGVTVTGRRPDTGPPIPDDKKAAYDAEVAREAAFRAYRASTPRLDANEKGVADPNDLSKDFPGLKSYIPPP
jgi:hypothetical protein